MLIIDMQNDFLSPQGIYKRPVSAEALLPPLTALLTAARQNNHLIVWVTSAYPERAERPPPMRPSRPDAPTFAAAPMNSDMLASGHAGRPCCRPGSEGARLFSSLTEHLRPEDLELTKHRYSAFMETSLADQLRAQNIHQVLLCGVVSNVCVRATAADAFFLGFKVTALSDAIGATSPQRHKEGLAAIERWYGEVRTTAEQLARWRARWTGLGAKDSAIWYGALPDALVEGAFERLQGEIDWQRMRHRGGEVPRLMSIQGTIHEGKVPVYRHPADAQPHLIPWTPTADALRKAVGALLGQDFNHALIQRYPDGHSYISHHADKTLDVARGTDIVNLSLGASRTMTLYPKVTEAAPVQRIDLTHNSVFQLGWETNRRFLHGIKRDKRQDAERRRDERAFGGERISLTLRTIATFMSPDGALSGQGARKPTAAPAEPREEALRMLEAFSEENKREDFDWDARYGEGFSSLNFELLMETT